MIELESQDRHSFENKLHRKAVKANMTLHGLIHYRIYRKLLISSNMRISSNFSNGLKKEMK
jgi:hypothetical protein